MKRIRSVFLSVVAFAIAILINLHAAQAQTWDGQRIKIDWNAETPVVTLQPGGIQVQVFGTPSAGWTVYLVDEELSPAVEAITIENASTVMGVKRGVALPTHINDVAVTFPYLWAEAEGVYVAEMDTEGCEGMDCTAYRRWKVEHWQAGPVVRAEPVRAPSADDDPVTSDAIQSIGAPMAEADLDEEDELEQLRAALTDRSEELAAARAEVEALEIELSVSKADFRRVEGERSTLKEEVATRDRRIVALEAAINERPETVSDASAALQHDQSELRRLALEVGHKSAKIREQEETIVELRVRIEAQGDRIAILQSTSSFSGEEVADAEVPDASPADSPPELEVEELEAPTPPVVAEAPTTSPPAGEEAGDTETVADDWGAAHLARMRALLEQAAVGAEPY